MFLFFSSFVILLVYEINEGVIEQQARIKLDFLGYDFFGTAVAMSGERLVVGAPRERSCNASDQSTNDCPDWSGGAFVYERTGGTTWAKVAGLKPPSTATGNDKMGQAVAIDGDVAVVGAGYEDSCLQGVQALPYTNDEDCSNSGAAYVFRRDGGGSWNFEAMLKLSTSEAGDRQGRAVAIQGNRIAVGAFRESSCGFGVDPNVTRDNACNFRGAATIYEYNGSVWNEIHFLKPSNMEVSGFGNSLAFKNNVLAIGTVQKNNLI